MNGDEIAKEVQAGTGYPTKAWDTGTRPTIVIRINYEQEAWAEAAGFWSVHLRNSADNIPFASEPTGVPESEEDSLVVANGIQTALSRLISRD